MSCEPEKPMAATSCDPCGPAVRNRYFRGKLMTVADYQAEQRYMIQRRRLINRTLHGWGIVSGFEVSEGKEQALAIAPGVGLDNAGRELVACDTVILREADDLLWLHASDCGLQAGNRFEAGEYVLFAHYAEREVSGVKVLDGCKEEHCEQNHICETVVYSVRSRDECPLPFTRDCLRSDDAGRGRKVDWPSELTRLAPAGDKGADDLCRGIDDTRCCGTFHPCRTHRLDRVEGLSVALKGGLPLALVRIEVGKCNIRFTRITEIIRDCALTRVAEVGWGDWIDTPEGKINFSDFGVKLSPDPASAPADQAQAPPAPVQRPKLKGKKPEGEPVDTGLWVRLSGPVQVASLRPDVMTITLLQRDSNEAVDTLSRVPIRALWVDDPCEGDPPDTTRRFRPMIGRRFWTGEIDPNEASGFEKITTVEIEIRTDFIVDWFGREVAGWGRHAPSRGTVTCGRFLTSIIVEPDSPTSGQPADAQAA
jgi:hypothetical protein